jgi:hypothetical protein
LALWFSLLWKGRWIIPSISCKIGVDIYIALTVALNFQSYMMFTYIFDYNIFRPLFYFYFIIFYKFLFIFLPLFSWYLNFFLSVSILRRRDSYVGKIENDNIYRKIFCPSRREYYCCTYILRWIEIWSSYFTGNWYSNLNILPISNFDVLSVRPFTNKKIC